jgi:molybdopterin synthase sulfur carrier subunit
MAVRILIPTPLQRLTNNKDVVEAEPGKIIDIINSLDKKFPGFAERLCQDGKIRRFINIYVNEEDVRFLQGEETRVKDGDEISIVPAIAGGKS